MLHRRPPLGLLATLLLAATVVVAGHARISAQGRGRGAGPGAAPATPRAAAPFDLTGYWVAIISEDWRFRMVTPLKGDYGGVPLSPEGRKLADTWEPSQDGSCLAYGAAALMRMPLRVHITWESDNVLKLETDAGMQTRRLMFDKSQQPGPRSLAGFSTAEWEFGPGRGEGRGGSLKVMTTNMTGGWLRRNGAPYSENAVVTEYWDQFAGPDGKEWFNVNTVVEDPTYLARPFITSSHFRKEPDASKFKPTACRSTAS